MYNYLICASSMNQAFLDACFDERDFMSIIEINLWTSVCYSI